MTKILIGEDGSVPRSRGLTTCNPLHICDIRSGNLQSGSWVHEITRVMRP